VTWSDLLDDPCFRMVEQDLKDAGLDLGDQALLRSRSWRWLRTHILGLLSKPMAIDATGQPIYPNRIQEHLYAPQIDAVRAQAAAATPS
jgi:hypothetical protein